MIALKLLSCCIIICSSSSNRLHLEPNWLLVTRIVTKLVNECTIIAIAIFFFCKLITSSRWENIIVLRKSINSMWCGKREWSKTTQLVRSFLKVTSIWSQLVVVFFLLGVFHCCSTWNWSFFERYFGRTFSLSSVFCFSLLLQQWLRLLEDCLAAIYSMWHRLIASAWWLVLCVSFFIQIGSWLALDK